MTAVSDLTADAGLRGHRVDVAWAWHGPDERPDFRLARRRRAYPLDAADGFTVLDTRELMRAPAEPWARIVRLRCVAANSGAEGGLVQAALTLSYAGPADATPARVDVTLAGAPAHRIEDVTALELTLPDPGPWVTVQALEITHAPGGGAPALAGTVTFFGGATASRLAWAPDGAAPAEVDFDVALVARTHAEVRLAGPGELAVTWTRTRGGGDLEAALADAAGDEDDARLALHDRFSEDSGDWSRSVEVADLGAVPEETAYYRLFAAAGGADWASARAWTASAAPTAGYGFVERVHGLLPSVHRYYDEPTPADRGQGQLRHFLEPFGVALDHLRSGAESLRSRHDLANARADFLPALGAWIAWPTDHSAPVADQRSDIRMAPAVYETVGTLPNIVALATRVTGWPCEAKEFVHNVFITNAPEAVPVRELFEMAHDGTAFGAPARLTATDRFDGHPAALLEPGGATRLFWHSNRSGRWELWTRTLAGDESTEPAPLEPRAAGSDQWPAAIRFPDPGGDAWLFWESDRDGAWDIWARVHDGADWGAPFPVTYHRAADRRPGVALGPAGELWVFWESERRGRPEIWARTFDGTAWSPPERVTEGLGQDREPAAALDAGGALWLVWRRDVAGRSRLYARAFAGGAWRPAAPLEDGPWRDEAPALARRGGELWLLWHSDRTGRWELWRRVHDGTDWGPPQRVTSRPEADKDPAVLVGGASLRVFWRRERIAPEYRSRTVDTGDVDALEQLGRLRDRLHYTYDAAREDRDWYARDVAALYLEPPPGTPDAVVADVLERARSYLAPFCPATVRLVLIPARPPETVDFFTDGFDADDPLADDFEDEIS